MSEKLQNQDPLAALDGISSNVLPIKIDQDSGQLIFGDEAFESTTFVVVGSRFSRHMFSGKYIPGNKERPICSSKDGATPDGGTAPLPGPCKTCPRSQWTKGKDGKNNVPPECAETYTVIAYDLEHHCLWSFGAKRTAIAAARQLRDGIKAMMLSASLKASPLPKNLHVKCTFRTASKVYGKKTYFIPVFVMTGLLSQDEASVPAAMAAGIANIQIVDDEGEEPAVDHGTTPVTDPKVKTDDIPF